MNQQQTIAAPALHELRCAEVPRLVQELEKLGQIVGQHFAPLNAEQLNWKPAPDEWSVGQCLDHIITTDEQYTPIFEQVIQGTMRENVWQKIPLLPRLFGDMLFRYVHPETTRPMSAPAIFRPSESAITLDVYDRFQAHQAQIISQMQACQHKHIDQLIISSPVAASMVYSLGDAFRVVVAHQYLHLMQAERVQQAAGFPTSGQFA